MFSRAAASLQTLELTDTREFLYEQHFGFARSPFSITPDPAFLYRTSSHERALDQLLRGVQRREGFMVLTGDIGLGKTMLCRALVERLGRRTFSALVLNPFVSEEELLRIILQDFGVVSRQEIRRTPLSATVPARAAHARGGPGLHRAPAVDRPQHVGGAFHARRDRLHLAGVKGRPPQGESAVRPVARGRVRFVRRPDQVADRPRRHPESRMDCAGGRRWPPAPAPGPRPDALGCGYGARLGGRQRLQRRVLVDAARHATASFSPVGGDVCRLPTSADVRVREIGPASADGPATGFAVAVSPADPVRN